MRHHIIFISALVFYFFTAQSWLYGQTTRQISVDLADDNNPGAGCALRDAIAIANSGGGSIYGCTVNSSGTGDPIVYRLDLPSYTYTLTGAINDNFNSTGDLDIKSNLQIYGQGQEETIIDGGNVDRVFDIDPAETGTYTIHFENLTIQNGKSNSSGGGLRNSGTSTLSLTNCRVTDNHTTNGAGGGIYNDSSLTLTDSSVDQNSTGGLANGGGIYNNENGILSIIHSHVDQNDTEDGDGGGIHNNRGTVVISENSGVVSNTTGGSGSFGGGIYNHRGNVTINDSLIQGNGISSTDRYGGGIYNYTISTLTLNNSRVWMNVAGGIRCRGGGIANYGTANINGSDISYNQASNGGGGIFNASEGRVIIDQQTVVSSNKALDSYDDNDGHGGGIYNTGVLHFLSGTITNNEAQNHGGGIYNASDWLIIQSTTFSDNECKDGTVGYGGAIHSPRDSTLSMEDSTLSGNSARFGGGIYTQGTLFLTNATLSGNSASVGGGGIRVDDDGHLDLKHLTISDNSAQSGGGIDNSLGTVQMFATVVAGNRGSSGMGDTTADCRGNIESLGYNLSGQSSGCPFSETGDQSVNSNTIFTEVLGPLAANEGPTQTHALMKNSPAVDAIPKEDWVLGLYYDQRGKSRRGDGNYDGIIGSDIGAYELYPFPWHMFLPATTAPR